MFKQLFERRLRLVFQAVHETWERFAPVACRLVRYRPAAT